jgi:hypothetical protein
MIKNSGLMVRSFSLLGDVFAERNEIEMVGETPTINKWGDIFLNEGLTITYPSHCQIIDYQ